VITSILTSTKKVLGLEDAYTVFDEDVMMHINSAFSTLNQLGIGPEDGYQITSKTPTWDAFFGTNLRYNGIKTYVFLRVKLLFDPPTTGYLVDATERQIKELEWRLLTVREQTEWVDPDPGTLPESEDELLLDGGGP
jgi:hypothetical protein